MRLKESSFLLIGVKIQKRFLKSFAQQKSLRKLRAKQAANKKAASGKAGSKKTGAAAGAIAKNLTPQVPATEMAEAITESDTSKQSIKISNGLVDPNFVETIPEEESGHAGRIARAIEAGDDETGVTIMQMAAGLDTGDMLAVHKTPITEATTAGTLHDTLAEQGAAALVDVLNRLGALPATPQNDTQATYARMLDKQEAVIDWQQPAAIIARLVRAFVPWPVAHASLAGQNIRFWQATALETPSDGVPGEVIAADRQGIDIATGDGILRVAELQLPGKRRMAARDAVNGRNWVGQRFGT